MNFLNSYTHVVLHIRSILIVLTMEHLKKRGFQLASRCPLCGKALEELNHLPLSLSSGFMGGPYLCPRSSICLSFLD